MRVGLSPDKADDLLGSLRPQFEAARKTGLLPDKFAIALGGRNRRAKIVFEGGEAATALSKGMRLQQGTDLLSKADLRAAARLGGWVPEHPVLARKGTRSLRAIQLASGISARKAGKALRTSVGPLPKGVVPSRLLKMLRRLG
jgi:hypothetical protein